MFEKTDPLAAVRAEQLLEDLLSRDREALITYDGGANALAAAQRIVAEHAVQFERKDNLRRVVLVGGWEVDPAAGDLTVA